MNWPDQSRWQACWSRLGDQGDSAHWYHRLTKAYAEPHRHYHNQSHLAGCLAELDQACGLASHPAEVEMALWFHDAVYDPRAANNEERSADLAVQCLKEGLVMEEIVERVRNLVLVTKRHEAKPDSDEAVMADVDLSILGQDQNRFARFEEDVRREYAWVPLPVFAAKRAKILEEFLERRQIFVTLFFRKKYEASARRNLQWAIGELGILGARCRDQRA